VTNSRSGALLERRAGSQRPGKLHLPDGAVDFGAGRDAVEFAATIGIVLDDWQRWLVEQLLAERADGRLAASTGVILVPRQNGKNVVLAVIELYGLAVAGLRRQVHSAHLGDTAAEHMKWLKEIVEDEANADELGHLRVYESNGKERISNPLTHGELTFNTRTKSTKRGASPQRIVFDEALYLTDEQVQAMTPGLAAQSMNVATSPQVLLTSSAPLAESVTLHRFREVGLAGGDPRMLVADWGCDPDADVRDRDAWYRANPGLGVRISEEFLESQLGRLTTEGFAIEHLGVVYGSDMASELPTWSQCCDPRSEIDGAPLAVAVDVAPDLSRASVAVAGRRADGVVHVELVEHLNGTGQAVAVLAAMWAVHKVPVTLDARSAAGGLLAELRAAGVEVSEVGTLDVVKACAGLKQSVATLQVRHRGQGPLDAAVAGAAVRTVGEGWAWARRSSSVDISPLVAVTLAHAGAGSPSEVPGEAFAIVL
jgi:phage terminase large subunit-like protein